ncbi:U-box domain-containing protein 33-like [Nymphaea colorata]|nr:U-box domain-containing protein 33-like [Nymphaea colorata]XP_031483012.1 U-box domain-containing protein 33-like [Nymphaea colorata]XP_031483013.1 U-box domain-containing protein 33-like [Nymphaea colorata]XP_031483015.1 U-box domain-containing protein 33-like [Nymphaea colorata]XP_031483016.1 U-box domain-containing protein 33-like [Nymphaea colorata]XP_031483017.1 U-box domain-containing protein 33-like [Nymphaea colorata]XP_031483018.1 U-box domain-containing protein 33-like [Nymphaea 
MDELHDFVERTMEEGFERLHKQQKAAQDEFRKQHEEDLKTIEELRDQLWQAKEERYQEMLNRQKAEQDAFEAEHRARLAEDLLTEEKKQRKAVEASLAKERLEVNVLREELRDAWDKKHSLGTEVGSLHCILDEMLRHQYEGPSEVENEFGAETELQNYTILTHTELVEATSNFSQGLKIGNGGLGIVYKGWIDSKMVAIKVLRSEFPQGSRFLREMINLLKLQHPHLATPIGLCLQPQSLVYDYLFNGSLEDRLLSKDGIRPLTWESRLRIAAEICSAIVFLHSNGITHGNLKPSNILLDGNLNVKIINSGISHLFRDHYHTYVNNDPGGLHSYMDPEFFEEGTLTKQVDIYSFGVIILRLLTGRSPLLLVEEVRKAKSAEKLKDLIDPVAGDWPYVHIVQLANLGLECCNARRDSRPDLKSHVLRVLKPMSPSSAANFVPPSAPVEPRQPPSYFTCPISQDIMQDPHVAADGFTYEAEALQAWFDGGHDTSPMTNLRLNHLNLIPNLALRSAIRDWLDNSSGS